MNIKNLLDVFDANRDCDFKKIHIIDSCMGNIEATFRTSSPLLDEIDDREIRCLSANAEDEICVWLEPKKLELKEESHEECND